MKEECIKAIGRQIEEGHNVLVSKIQKIQFDGNAYGRAYGRESLWSTSENLQQWESENKQKFYKKTSTIDPAKSHAWAIQTYNVLRSYLPEDNIYLSKLESYTKGNGPNEDGVKNILALLDVVKRDIEEEIIKVAIKNDTQREDISMIKAGSSKKIFIVHGHDEDAKSKAEIFVRKMLLDPIILSDQTSEGKTIIEKLEKYTDVGFGIVLYTPCDETSDGKKRARQNVVLEHGYLLSKLSREKVCMLVKGDVEIPGDLDGVVFIKIIMDAGNAWELDLARELRAAGYDEADANKL